MKKPQDSDIFGTKTISYAPRIINQQKIDPNTNFQSRMDAQYDAYTQKIGSSHRGAFDQKTLHTKVNQQVNFDQNYHHFRKDADLQSSIFYQPSNMGNSRLTQRCKITERHVPKHAYNMQDIQSNYGKKQTLDRQVRTMAQNTTQFKGNSSNIFGYDQHTDRNGVKNKIQKLIPHQMQWMEHDSIKYQNNTNINGIDNLGKNSNKKFEEIMESKSQMFKVNNDSKQNNSKNANTVANLLTHTNTNINMKKKQIQKNPEQKQKLIKSLQKITTKQIKSIKNIDTNKKKINTITNKDQIQSKNKNLNTAIQENDTKIQIQILKGWSSNIMEDLSKYCRLNSTKIISVNFQDNGKGKLILAKSKRWECITDWLRKDAKLKIRVYN